VVGEQPVNGSAAALLAGAGLLITAMVIHLALYGDPHVPGTTRVTLAALTPTGLLKAIIGGLSYLL
jgi:hypothetical protein